MWISVIRKRDAPVPYPPRECAFRRRTLVQTIFEDRMEFSLTDGLRSKLFHFRSGA